MNYNLVIIKKNFFNRIASKLFNVLDVLRVKQMGGLTTFKNILKRKKNGKEH